jgi:hypothetical protein
MMGVYALRNDASGIGRQFWPLVLLLQVYHNSTRGTRSCFTIILPKLSEQDIGHSEDGFSLVRALEHG